MSVEPIGAPSTGDVRAGRASAPPPAPHRHRSGARRDARSAAWTGTARSLAALIAVGGLTLAGCGGDDGGDAARAVEDVAAATTLVETRGLDAAAAPIGVATSVAPAAPSTAASTLAPAVVPAPPASPPSPPPAPIAPPLPTPIDPPQDEHAPEPVIELGSIEIPKLGVVAPLHEGIRLSTFDRGPGHWPGTAMPGEFGNSVIGGHRTSSTKPFRHLDRLSTGDEVVFTTATGRFVYRVTSSEIVTPDQLRVVAQNPGFEATLFACHPVGSTDERIVVHLVLASS